MTVVVLGLDPGSLHTGYGLLERRGREWSRLAHGRISVPRGAELAARLARLAAALDELLDTYSPTAVAVENPFHGVNPKSLIVLAQARGALLATVGRRGLSVFEYSPAEVKSAVTGNGRAGKEQVARMVGLLLGFSPRDLPVDASDALAVALCYAQRQRVDTLRRAAAGPK